MYNSHIAVLRESQLQFRIAAQEQAGQRDREFRMEINAMQERLLKTTGLYEALQLHVGQIEARHAVELDEVKARYGAQLNDIEIRHAGDLKKMENQYNFHLNETETRHVAECARTHTIYEGGRRQLVSQLNAANQMVRDSGARLEGYLLRQPIAAAPAIKGKLHLSNILYSLTNI